jgi:hypothetical protein
VGAARPAHDADARRTKAITARFTKGTMHERRGTREAFPRRFLEPLCSERRRRHALDVYAGPTCAVDRVESARAA